MAKKKKEQNLVRNVQLKKVKARITKPLVGFL